MIILEVGVSSFRYLKRITRRHEATQRRTKEKAKTDKESMEEVMINKLHHSVDNRWQIEKQTNREMFLRNKSANADLCHDLKMLRGPDRCP